MQRKRERILWVSLSTVLLVVIMVSLLSPVVFAQTIKRRDTQNYLDIFETTLSILKNNYVDEVDTDALFKGAMDGLFEALDDPHSVYLDAKSFEQMHDTTEGKYGGVGLYISREGDDEDGSNGRLPYVKIVAPIENTPSWRAGLNAGDYIYAIENESAEGFSTQDVSDRLRGKPGSRVTVTVRRDDFTFDVNLTRAEIEIPTVRSTVIDNSIGYLRIIEFTPFTASRVEENLKEFATRGLNRLIIDVRNNPGGLLNSVVNVADLFFSGGEVVSTRYRQKNLNRIYKASPGKVVPSRTQIAVLIDRGSASASEILTGALKDRKRATVIGEKSFGKGSIQQIIPLGSAAIKLTTGRYYTPSDISIDAIGIEPEIPVKEPEFSESQTEAYASLLKDNRVGLFVDKNPTPSTSEISAFISRLRSEGLDPGERTVRIMVKREVERRLNSPPVVDLEYDLALLRAVRFLKTGK